MIERLEALQSSLKDAETGQRGFLLTGEERYLEPFTNARTGLPGLFKDLRAETAASPGQQRRLDMLEELSKEKLDELAQTIDLRRAGNADAATHHRPQRSRQGGDGSLPVGDRGCGERRTRLPRELPGAVASRGDLGRDER